MEKVNQEKIDLLNELIKDIEDQRKVRESVPKSLYAPAKDARNYYRGINEGVYIALRIIHERIGRIKNDCNTNQDESAT